MIVYKKLQFPTLKKRPYFFSNFVSSIDGRTVIRNKPEYPPIGSATDFETFLDLRKYADALIHGKHTAATHRTIETIAQKPFLQKRKKQGKSEFLPYFILSNHPDLSLIPALIQNPLQKPFIVTHKNAVVAKDILDLAIIVRIGETTVNMEAFSLYLFKNGYKHILVEGGPTLMGSFFLANLIDEMFITIAPKIFNGSQNEFLTMTQGQLLKPKNIKKWNLIETKAVASELFLRYRKEKIV